MLLAGYVVFIVAEVYFQPSASRSEKRRENAQSFLTTAKKDLRFPRQMGCIGFALAQHQRL